MMRKRVMLHDVHMEDVRNGRYGSRFGYAFRRQISDDEWETIEHTQVFLPPDVVPEGGLRVGWYADFIGDERMERQADDSWTRVVSVAKFRQYAPDDPRRLDM